jgi:hypothetical protein
MEDILRVVELPELAAPTVWTGDRSYKKTEVNQDQSEERHQACAAG